jgi:integrase
LQALVDKWSLQQVPRTVRRQYGVVRAVFAYAVASDWLARSPCRGIKLPAVAELDRPQIGAEEVGALALAVDVRYRPMIYMGAVLGLRWGEIAGIRAGSLDLLRSILHVREQLGRDGLSGPPKSAAGRRTMTMPRPLVDLLADHLARMGLSAAQREALVLTAPEGGSLDYSHWRRRV